MDTDHNDSPPPPPPLMSTPQNQLTLSLLNNLLQMQGLENSIMNHQQHPTNATTPPSTTPSSQPTSPTITQPSYNPQLLLEQQIKLSQLQQLQRLQNQIFQQQVLFFPRFIIKSPFVMLVILYQIALISGQSPLTSIVDSAKPQNQSGDQHIFTGLQTPGNVTRQYTQEKRF
jgi:hypothetical protein